MQLKIRRLGYALGAEITGVDLTRALDEDTVSAIRKAWLDHVVLCFPGQDLGPETLCAFGERFGELDDRRATPHLRHPDCPPVYVLVNNPVKIKDRVFRGMVSNNWHTDNSYTVRAASATFLNAKELPEVGGDTMFANTYMAYDALSPALQGLLEPLEGVHDVSMGGTFQGDSAEVQAERRRRNPLVAHPVVRIHPETGRKALYVGSRVRNFAGLSEEETKPILNFLNQHATRYEFIYRHRWAVNDLLMWDNRCSMHYAVPDYDRGQMRRLIRCNLLPPKSGRLYDDAALAAPGKTNGLLVG
jgi:taurine dioxygenase